MAVAIISAVSPASTAETREAVLSGVADITRVGACSTLIFVDTQKVIGGRECDQCFNGVIDPRRFADLQYGTAFPQGWRYFRNVAGKRRLGMQFV
jgi:hypothetical protein